MLLKAGDRLFDLFLALGALAGGLAVLGLDRVRIAQRGLQLVHSAAQRAELIAALRARNGQPALAARQAFNR
jgi:hypothetical protein